MKLAQRGLSSLQPSARTSQREGVLMSDIPGNPAGYNARCSVVAQSHHLPILVSGFRISIRSFLGVFSLLTWLLSAIYLSAADWNFWVRVRVRVRVLGLEFLSP